MKKKNQLLTKILSLLTLAVIGFGAMPYSKTNTVYASVAEEHDHSSWENWGDVEIEKTTLPGESGEYVLTSDITLSGTWTVPAGDTKLCLNGYVINWGGCGYLGSIIGTGATLNLFDCGSKVHYFTKEDGSGLWKLAEDQSTPTDYFVNGGCITGASGAISCTDTGCFNMYGGNIVGNKTLDGGGIYNASKFYMYGGTIIGNQADESGGGLYSTSSAVSVLAGGEITKNTANSETGNGSGVYYKTEECFVAGTQITMADGTKQAIEDLSVGDLVRVFDHNSGLISSSKLFDVGLMYLKQSGVVNLHFSNDIDISVVYGHSFFERDLNMYVPVTKDNVYEYVGHQFYNADNACWETLLDYDFVEGEVDTYIIASEYNLNCVANGMLCVEDGLYTALSNTFELDDNLAIDQVKKDQDIGKYGIYEFENLKYINRHTYETLGFENLNVTFGKGLFSKEKFEFLEYISATYDPEIYCDVNERAKPKPRMSLNDAINENPVDAPTDAGLYVGGSIKIIDNAVDNLYLPATQMVTIGTGTTGDGKGVPSPTKDMLIGITLENDIGPFTNANIIDYSANFFSDSEDCVVQINNGGTDDDPSDDFLELVYVYAITNKTKEADKAINNGYIEVKENAIEDEEVTVAVYPNQGYILSSLIYNDGTEDHNITSTKSFTMPNGAVTVTATFEGKGEQEVTIVLSENDEFIYPNTPCITEKQTYSSSNYYEKLGDGVVTVEYKPQGADDSEYTTEVPTEYGKYTIRVSVAEGSEYLAGFATKDFTYSPQTITQVGFGNLQQPVAGAVVPEKTGGMLVDTKYTETLTWYPEISTVNKDGKKIFDCNTTYTATVTLTIKDSLADNHVFAKEPTLKGPAAGTGWVLSKDSTNKTLIYTKEFQLTADHSVNETSLVAGQSATCTEDGFEDAYKCETCGLYYEDEACSELIGDETAYNEWILGDGKISASGHETSLVPGQSATCTQDGYEDAYCCDNCGMYYEDADATKLIGDESAYNEWISGDGKVSKTGHETSLVDGQDPTCTQDGYEDAYYCADCGMYFENADGTGLIGDSTAYNSWKLDGGKISASGHHTTIVNGEDPTYTEDGYKDAYYCADCGMYYEDADGTKLIGDQSTYNTWKLNEGLLPRLLSVGALVGICIGSFFLLLLIIYVLGYFFLYRKGKLDERKIKVIYKILPRGEYNLKEDKE